MFRLFGVWFIVLCVTFLFCCVGLFLVVVLVVLVCWLGAYCVVDCCLVVGSLV